MIKPRSITVVIESENGQQMRLDLSGEQLIHSSLDSQWPHRSRISIHTLRIEFISDETSGPPLVFVEGSGA